MRGAERERDREEKKRERKRGRERERDPEKLRETEREQERVREGMRERLSLQGNGAEVRWPGHGAATAKIQTDTFKQTTRKHSINRPNGSDKDEKRSDRCMVHRSRKRENDKQRLQ